MTIRIDSMYISPVKSLALQRIDGARLDKPGIAGDRSFYMLDARGKLFTQRDHFPMVQVRAEYDVAKDWLRLTFPGGSAVEGVPEPGDPVDDNGAFFGRPISGRVAGGGFGEALSEFAGQPLRLVRPQTIGSTFDGYPISICSMESLQALASAANEDAVDGRRFRQNIYISGTAAHGEDEWIGGTVRVGEAVIRVKVRDIRCVMTTRDPDTGDTIWTR
jgi:MOSC domain-containing protein